MAFNWDLLISVLIILGIILVVIARVTGQKITDLLRDIKELISEWRESAVERGEELVYYE